MQLRLTWRRLVITLTSLTAGVAAALYVHTHLAPGQANVVAAGVMAVIAYALVGGVFRRVLPDEES